MDYLNILTILISGFVSAIVSILLFNFKEWKKNVLDIQSKRRSVLDKYREFISVSAFELQSRLHNILVQNLFSYADSKEPSYSGNVRYYTIFLIGQFFAWKEILRKEMHYLDFRKGKEEIAILEKLEQIERSFTSDKVGNSVFMIFRGEQRAIGECMTIFNEATGSYECIGYSKFIEQLSDEKCEGWFRVLLNSIDVAITESHASGKFSSPRLLRIQGELIDLLNTLDPDKKRFPKNREKIDPNN